MNNLAKYPEGGRRQIAYKFMSKSGVLMYIFRGGLHLDERHQENMWYYSTWDGFSQSAGQDPSNTPEEAECKAT